MSSQPEQSFYEFGPFRVDTLKRLLLREGRAVPLTAKAFDTLLILLRHSGQDMDKDELMRSVWPDTIVEENNLTQNVSMLRKALGDSRNEHRYIVTIPGRGYRFVASVREVCGPLSERLTTDSAEPVQAKPELRNSQESQPRPSDPALQARQHPEPPDNSHEPAPAAAVDSFAPTAKDERGPAHRLPEAASSEKASLPAGTSLSEGASSLVSARAPFLKRATIISLLCIALALLFWWLMRPHQPAAEKPAPPGSIAVLPFKPLDAKTGDDYLGLGMADALITKLSNIRQINVRPTSAVLKFAGGAQPDPVAAGRELNVDSVVEGSIQKDGDRVRVTVQLVSVRERRPLWAQSFGGRMTDIFTVQDSISAQVAEALTLKLTGEEQRLLAKRYTENVEAYQSYLRGRYFWNKRSEESLARSIAYFNEAIDRDPVYALAYAGLADAYSVIGFYQFGRLAPEESYRKAKAAALRALELDETLAEAHASLALAIGDVDNDDAAAEREYRRAIELNPSYATAHHWYSDFLALTGRPNEAMSEIKRALELDPLSLVINATLGERLYHKRQYDAAIAQLRKTLEMDGAFGPAHYLLGLALEQKGLYDEAIAELNQARTLSGNNPWMVSALGHTLARAGKRTEAQRVLSELQELSKERHVTPYDFAIVYQGLGQPERAVEWLRKMHGEKLSRAINDDPRMESIKQDTRFQSLSQS